MKDSMERIKKEIAELIDEGFAITAAEQASQGKKQKDHSPEVFRYQKWYTRALAVVRQLIPERLPEFKEQYKLDKRKGIDSSTYTISDYLLGLRVTEALSIEEVLSPFNSFTAFIMRFQNQMAILESAQTRVDSILADIKGIIRADLFDSELETTRELLKNDYFRPAGVVAGVVLEGHFSAVCENHMIKITKKNPGIGDYNDKLKDGEVYDTPTWRFIQRLGDIRNLCGHKRKREPTKEEVEELISGVEKVTKTVF